MAKGNMWSASPAGRSLWSGRLSIRSSSVVMHCYSIEVQACIIKSLQVSSCAIGPEDE